MNYEQLNQLNELRQKGAISEEEYQREKERILNSSVAPRDSLFGFDIRTYCMLIHLSQLAGFIFPVAGMAVPIVLWAINKDKSAEIDQHGKIVLNWIISSFIYFAVLGIFSIILIGIPFIIALGICSVVFIIIGALKAKDGILWKYPLSIDFIK